METGRVIEGRYLLQRLLKRGQVCAVYQGVDQVLKRLVAVKSVPAAHAPAYHHAIRVSAAFSHPNIIGLYDLISESESLHIVQEYVEGDDFVTLLQRQLPPYEVADFGQQLCLALLYASSTDHKVNHGDLTPACVIRDASGLVRITNFALPGDLAYFQRWHVLGGDGNIFSDPELSYGLWTEGRNADDTRAVGLLLYQLLTGRPVGATVVEPPANGILLFQRHVPQELCQAVARAVVRQHPQPIKTVEELYAELKVLAEIWEPVVPVPITAGSRYQGEEMAWQPQPQSFVPTNTGRVSVVLPTRNTENPGLSLSAYGAGGQSMILPPSPPQEVAAGAPTVADMPLPPQLVKARQAAYGQPAAEGQRRLPLWTILLLGVLLFALFFAVGYVAGLVVIPH